MSEYIHQGWFLLRSPFLSFEQGDSFLKSAERVWSALEDPRIANVLAISSPRLYQELLDFRQSNDFSVVSPKGQSLQRSLFNTLSRMTYRSVPYAAFAGVGRGTIGRQNEIRFKSQSDYQMLQIEATAVPKIEAKTKFKLNPSVHFRNETLGYYRKNNLAMPLYETSLAAMPKSLMRHLEKNPGGLDATIKKHLAQMQILLPQTKQAARSASVELFKPTMTSEISAKSAETILKGAELLIDLYGYATTPSLITGQLKSTHAEFFARFEHREVSLLEAMQPTHPFYQAFMRTRKYDPLITRTPTDIYPHSPHLFNLLSKAESDGAKVIHLTAGDVDKMRQAVASIQHEKHEKKIQPPALTAFAAEVPLEEGNVGYHLRSILGIRSVPHFARYLHLDNKLKNDVQSLVKNEERLTPDAMLAEIIYEPDQAELKSVIPQTGLYEACININAQHVAKGPKQIELSDLYLSSDGARLRLRSRKYNREVIPVLTSLLMPIAQSHPLFRFLGFLATSEGFAVLSWDWGSQLIMRSFHPRVQFHNLILKPATWHLPKFFIEKLKAERSQPDKVRTLLRERGVPDVVQAEIDNVPMHFDFKNDLSVDSFFAAISEKKALLVEEVFGSTLTQGPEGHFAHDLVIPYLKTGNDSRRPLPFHTSPVAQDRLPKKAVVFPPGSEWTYLQLGLESEDADYFITQRLMPIVKTWESWFFLKYVDPDFQIRLRVHGPNGKKAVAFAKRCFDKNQITKFSIETYHREIERYGGLAGCKIFEDLSCFDSQAALDASKFFISSSEPRRRLWMQAACFSAYFYMDAVGYDFSQLKRPSVLGKAYDASEAAVLGYLRETKSAFLTGTFSHSEKVLYDIYERRSSKQTELLRKLKALSASNRLGVSLNSYAESLIHLSLVRLDQDLSRLYEMRVLQALREMQRNQPRLFRS